MAAIDWSKVPPSGCFLPDDEADRLRLLRHRWIALLEEDANQSEAKPSYEADGMRYDWSERRLNLMLCIREASALLGELQK